MPEPPEIARRFQSFPYGSRCSAKNVGKWYGGIVLRQTRHAPRPDCAECRCVLSGSVFVPPVLPSGVGKTIPQRRTAPGSAGTPPGSWSRLGGFADTDCAGCPISPRCARRNRSRERHAILRWFSYFRAIDIPDAGPESSPINGCRRTCENLEVLRWPAKLAGIRLGHGNEQRRQTHPCSLTQGHVD